MKTSTVQTLVWLYIYGGMIVGALGLSVQRKSDALGWTMVVVGGVSIAVGVVLIYVRSRMNAGAKP